MSDTNMVNGQVVCGYTGDDYAQVMSDLLPRGWVWPRDAESVQQRVIRGLAEEYARILARDCDLLSEAYPCGASETLEDWERLLGLPDECTGPLDTIQERRLAVCAKLIFVGGQSEEFFIALAAALGYEITIETFTAFYASEGSIGDPLNDAQWLFVWQVNISGSQTIWYFRASESAAGEPLASWGSSLLECMIRAAAPAHTWLIFNYTNYAVWDGGDSIWDGGASIWDEVVGR